MQDLNSFALDLLAALSDLFEDIERWNHALERLRDQGFNALNIACFSPKTGDIFWARSSMSDAWLREYETEGYATVDHVLAQVYDGTETHYVDSATETLNKKHPPKKIALHQGLVDAGYLHLYSLVVPCPEDEAKLIVLSSNKPEAEQAMTENERGMRILATVLATNLGSDTNTSHGRIHDLTHLARFAPVLTQREREVMSLLASGLRNDRIAEQLGLSEITIRTHLRSARQKLDAPTREAALVRAVQLGLLDLPDYRNR